MSPGTRSTAEPLGADPRAQLERAAEHYVQACFRKQATVRASEFALELGLTPPYLSRISAGIFKEGIRSFLRQKQLEYAARLLLVTPLTIEQIALNSGFGAPKAFYRAFRRAYGMTPNTYRIDKE
jgi:AraC-like DNA-binding protein